MCIRDRGTDTLINVEKLSFSDQDYSLRYFGDFEPNTSIDSSIWSEIDSTNVYIEALMSGSKWGDVADPGSTTTELNYYTYSGEYTLDDTYGNILFDEERTAFVNAMVAFENVANITFTESNSISDSHILWASLDDIDSGGSLGYAYLPSDEDYGGLATINYAYYYDPIHEEIDDAILSPGSYYLSLIHI